MTTRFIHPGLRTKKPEETIRFYGKYFGFKENARADLGVKTLVFLKNPESESELEFSLDKNASLVLGDGFNHLAFSVSDLDAIYKQCKDDNLNPTEPVDVKVGDAKIARLFFVNDPNGYLVEIVQREGRWQ